MATLMKAHEELFRRTPDESFGSFEELLGRCRAVRDESGDHWVPPDDFKLTHDLTLPLEDNPDYRLNDWSFSQLCRLAGVSKDTLNRLSPKTAGKALEETLPYPPGGKPYQVLSTGDLIRSVHGTAYTRLWNADLLAAVGEAAPEFTPPPQADAGGSGLYCGEQDLFAFLIDPDGWVDIQGEQFAPGFFVWNSEVGRRSLGLQTFWFQRVCGNHIVWDVTEVTEFSRKHTANVREGLDEIRRRIEALTAQRDLRRDGFASTVRKAAHTRLGDDAESVLKVLSREGIPKELAKQAIAAVEERKAFSVFSLVDALTRLTQTVRYAGDRTELDQKVAALLALAA